MHRAAHWTLWAVFLSVLAAPLGAEEPAAHPAAERTVEQLAAQAKKSVVVISFAGRDGKSVGLGSGVIIAPDGLIATNLHVIGEARAITVQTFDGKKYEATSVHASDRAQDLALIKIDAQNLPALPLGDSDTLQDGQAVVAVGNPHGLRHSVVAGVVSGRRELDGKKMIQIAIPIEPGNSGGPLLDMQGRVQGLLTIKSLVTENLGFAVEINTLKKLIEKPNPIPMSRWLTIGALDPKEWTPHLGARWRQRAGQVHVDGLGSGFGGRSYCLSSVEVPPPPFELAVTVKLDDESGAAGLIFCAQGDWHYGFYPTSGQLRLTRFEGPDVNSWTILHSAPSRHYRQGDWNTIKVRVEAEKIVCFVNGEKWLEFADAKFREGQVGLAKFRQTSAQFKNFRIARELPDPQDEAGRARLARLVSELPAGKSVDHLLESLAPDAPDAALFEERARALEWQAAQLRQLAHDLHVRRTVGKLQKVLDQEESRIDLVEAGLLIALLDNPELDVAAYRKEFEALADEARARVPAGASETARLTALTKYLFDECGFHGSRAEYYNAANSYLNQVLDDREGIPITLSVVFMECARRLDLNVQGVGLPGHFVVKHVAQDGAEQLIDVFENGKLMTREEAAAIVANASGEKLRDEHLQGAKKRAIVLRMLANLASLARRAQNAERLLRYQEAVVALSPQSGADRWLRAVLRYQTNRFDGAMRDVEWLLEHPAPEVPPEQVLALQKVLEESRR